MGLSDRTVDLDLFALEVRIDDVRAVMDAVRSERAFILGAGNDGGSIAAMFGATHRDRTHGLILYRRARRGSRPTTTGTATIHRDHYVGGLGDLVGERLRKLLKQVDADLGHRFSQTGVNFLGWGRVF
jgi:pimeloyl-ACP methyl ester carboxylesterase